MWDFFSFVSPDKGPGRGRSGCSRSSQLAPGRCRGGSRGGTARLLTGPGRSYRKRVGPRGGGKAVPPQKKNPWRVSWCPGSSACERGCVTDPLLSGCGERGGRSSLPLLARGKAFRGCLRAFPGIVWDFSPTRPLRSLLERCECSRRMTRSGNFIIRLGTMPGFQEGLKPNQWTRTKCRTSLVGPLFLHPSWACSPYPLPGGCCSQLERDHLSPCPLPPSGEAGRRGEGLSGPPGGVWAGLALFPGGILCRTTL